MPLLNKQILIDELKQLNSQFADQLEIYEQTAANQGLALTDYIAKVGNFDLDILRKAFAKAYGVDPIPVELEDVLKTTKEHLPLQVAKAQNLVIFEDLPTGLKIATSNPANLEAISLLTRKVNKPVAVYYAFNDEIIAALNEKAHEADFSEQIANLKVGSIKDFQDMEALKNSSRLLDIILLNSIEFKASDIHIEPHKGRVIVRFRIDGLLKDILELPANFADIINSRIKVLAEMRTDEHSKPQDGRFKLELNETTEITTRVSILPTYEGEKVVMRILKEKKQKINLTDLGYSQKNQDIIYGNTDKAHGMLLVTGPTGSGKTTTLYTVLKLLNKPNQNVMTVEDPIEYRLDRVNQIQVNPAAGLTFAGGLRSILRQDPDVVMVGEIRDNETANIAVNAALTGHLVLATLHTNSAVDTLPRLLQMDVEPYLVASTVNVVIAQRLVRGLCEHCTKTIELTEELPTRLLGPDIDTDFGRQLMEYYRRIIPDGTKALQAVGCDKCNNLGYSGRFAIAEVLEVTDEVKELIYQHASPIEIEKLAKTQGFTDMLEDGLNKVKNQQTTLEEVIRVLKA